MIELELSIVFLMAIFFTVMFVPKKDTVWGVLAFACWQVTAFLWTAISPMSSTYSIALLFQGIAILMLLVVVINLLLGFRKRKYEPSELD